MQSEIQALPWMGAATKEQALTKLHAIANKIGYPDKWRDYSALDIVRGDEMGNSERASWFEFHRWLAKDRQARRPQRMGHDSAHRQRLLRPQKNDINFPAGILQPPLFSAKSDAAPNYGDTGATMGHELTHAFDDEGSQFDATGQPPQLVDRRRPQGVRKARAMRSRSIFRLHHHRRHQNQR